MTVEPTLQSLAFMKMHGAGNDFVVIDARSGNRVTAALARGIGDRHRGVGFDQLAEIMDGTDGAEINLRFWNSDGTTAEACGNATRCVAAHILGQTGADRIAIRTERGLLAAKMYGGKVHVNMGMSQHHWSEIPLAMDVDVDRLPLDGAPMAVGMGNPHCVFFVEDAASVDVAGRGSAIEHDPLFPSLTNVEFAEVRSPTDIRMRVWERGAGMTLACGSGACATVVAAHRKGLTGPVVDIELDGGWLSIEIAEDGVWMGGPTAYVFDGVLTADFFEGLA